MPPSDSGMPSQEAAKPSSRRFVPEVIESSTRSSKPNEQRHDSPSADEAPKARRFVPELIEASSATRSSRKESDEGGNDSKPRRFAPQVIEVTQKSRHGQAGRPQGGHIKFEPQPVETTFRSNRSSGNEKHAEPSTRTSQSGDNNNVPRKWVPELLDTAKWSRRAGASPSAFEDRRTEAGHRIHAREHQRHLTDDDGDDDVEPLDTWSGASGHGTTDPIDIPPDNRRRLAPLDGSSPSPRRSDLFPSRNSSFRCPGLETIESSESERGTDPSSLSSSPSQDSPLTTTRSSFNESQKNPQRVRESVDDNFSHYLLTLEAKRAQKRLQEQALAAFPNSDFHEPVQHYVDADQGSDEMDVDDRPSTWDGLDADEPMLNRYRRESTEVDWAQREMQEHAEFLEQERNANKVTAKPHPATPQSPWWNSATGAAGPEPANEMRSMRDRARPPMLGSELVFPRCMSPEPARFDPTQGPDALRRQMCYLTSTADAGNSSPEGGLWNIPDPQPSVRTSTSTSSSKKGLWGGFCVRDGSAGGGLGGAVFATGLVTPQVEPSADVFAQAFSVPRNAARAAAPPTPPAESHDPLAALDDAIAAEFPDTFVTQVYNYLSLGYPALARGFDEELAKISGIAVADLRRNDRAAHASPRGYIRFGPDFEDGGIDHGHNARDGVPHTPCPRWTALQLYVREWARQEKTRAPPGDLAPGRLDWGTVARRGSWRN